MSFSHEDFDFASPVWNTSAIMNQAWEWAKAERGYDCAYDWTPGIGYGKRIPVPASTRRAIFSEKLKLAWAAAKGRVAREERDRIERTNPEARSIRAALSDLQWQPSSFGLEAQRKELRERLETIVEAVRANMAQKRDMARKAAIIASAGGRITSVTFTKKDGTRRVMKINPAKLRLHLKGKDASEAAREAAATRKERHPHLMPVWDIEADAARSVNLLTVSRIATGGRVYRFAA